MRKNLVDHAHGHQPTVENLKWKYILDWIWIFKKIVGPCEHIVMSEVKKEVVGTTFDDPGKREIFISR